MDTNHADKIAYNRAWLMFSCGIRAEDFKRQFDSRTPKDREVLGKVAWRMTVANIVRHQLRYRSFRNTMQW